MFEIHNNWLSSTLNYFLTTILIINNIFKYKLR